MARKNFRGRCLSAHKAPAGYVHLALCLNYAGTAFRGLQIQAAGPTHHTVEGVLLQALADAGLIDGIERGRPRRPEHHFARACRTDRGVHAIRNLVSLFVARDAFVRVGQCTGARERLNALLPPQVRIAAVTRVLGSFIPRNCCDRRVYRYLLPAYALLPPADGWATLGRYYAGWVEGVSAMVRAATAAAEEQTRPAGVDSGTTVFGDLFLNLGDRSPRFGETSGSAGATAMLDALAASVARFNDILAEHFVGCHRFHNLSVDAEPPAGAPRTSATKVVRPDCEESSRVIHRCEVAPRVYLLPCRVNSGSVSLCEYAANCSLAAESVTVAGDATAVASAGAAAAGSGAGHTAVSGFSTPVSVSSAALTTPTATTAAPLSSGQPTLPTHLPFLVFQIEGGSFLFNMIRKIVGATLAVCRGASPSLLADALSPEMRVTTPLAPGSYLFLALSTYRAYDSTLRAMTAHRLSQKAAAGAVPAAAIVELPEAVGEMTASVALSSAVVAQKTTQTSASGSAVDLEPEPALQPLQDAWCGRVAAACERFATRVICEDVVGVDLGAVPPLDEMLAARDRARRVTRPQWEAEDAHLANMKEYTPSDVIVARSRRTASASSSLSPFSSASPPATEMTKFLRMLRVHNWSVKCVRLPPECKAMLEEKNKRAKREAAAAMAAKASAGVDLSMVAVVTADTLPDNGEITEHVSGEALAGAERFASASAESGDATVLDDGEDGWIFVAATRAEERLLRQRYFTRRWKRARPWEDGASSMTNARKAGVDSMMCAQDGKEVDDAVSETRSE